ncbi:MAG: Rsd/AlgQ family anti-sigma factor [gamma proteobacterium endosymbiont of Lamellibrachia anaximandri]|nr:Rsd/AlgQ family anti-sigma factor [gamma proteobacterium endosymbiont of Lamellibrachia anaximandri]
MNTQQRSGGERRTGTQGMIDKLLDERQEMLVLFCQVAGLEPYSRTESLEKLLQTFCQVLVDYTAFGHFEVFGHISDGSERRSRVIKVAEEIYPGFVEATEAAVNFNDKYDLSDHELELSKLSKDLSSLGEELAIRVELEDRLVATMLAR